MNGEHKKPKLISLFLNTLQVVVFPISQIPLQ